MGSGGTGLAAGLAVEAQAAQALGLWRAVLPPGGHCTQVPKFFWSLILLGGWTPWLNSLSAYGWGRRGPQHFRPWKLWS